MFDWGVAGCLTSWLEASGTGEAARKGAGLRMGVGKRGDMRNLSLTVGSARTGPCLPPGVTGTLGVPWELPVRVSFKRVFLEPLCQINVSPGAQANELEIKPFVWVITQPSCSPHRTAAAGKQGKGPRTAVGWRHHLGLRLCTGLCTRAANHPLPRWPASPLPSPPVCLSVCLSSPTGSGKLPPRSSSAF